MSGEYEYWYWHCKVTANKHQNLSSFLHSAIKLSQNFWVPLIQVLNLTITNTIDKSCKNKRHIKIKYLNWNIFSAKQQIHIFNVSTLNSGTKWICPPEMGNLSSYWKKFMKLWYGGVLLSNLVILNFKLFLSSNSMRH